MEHAKAALKESPLDQLAKAIYRINRDNGWFEGPPRSIGDELMLIVGEVAEAHEEDRKGKGGDERYYTYKLAGQDYLEYQMNFVGDEVHAWHNGESIALEDLPVRMRKPEGIPSEMADIVIRVLDFCYRYKIDLEAVLLEKLAFNETRGHRHGGKRI
jgi:NTP pyrophosphatase (non-canonical NTP hydrolase)